jgi:hypothetical protein
MRWWNSDPSSHRSGLVAIPVLAEFRPEIGALTLVPHIAPEALTEGDVLSAVDLGPARDVMATHRLVVCLFRYSTSRGRGPTMLISPRITFTSSASSPMLLRLQSRLARAGAQVKDPLQPSAEPSAPL